MLSRDEIQQWLRQHIPLRVTAGIAGSEICDEWAAADDFPGFPLGLRSICLHDAVYLGRMAAVRWLIEFVGIQEVNDRTAGLTPRPSRAAKASLYDALSSDFGLGMLPGGTFFLPDHEHAELLAKTWSDCARATSHPTRGNNQPDVSAATLTSVMRVIIQHLDATAYAHAKLTVREAVMMQLDARFRNP